MNRAGTGKKDKNGKLSGLTCLNARRHFAAKMAYIILVSISTKSYT